MTVNEDRFSMTAERYLAKHNVLVYLEDGISQLLEHREDNPKVSAVKFISDYFSSLRDGNHTMFREYAFVRSTPHNRASFVKLFWKCYKQIGKKGDLLSIQEYHSLLGLLCADFPFTMVQKTARIILIDDALDCLICFSDFIYALQVQFYYEEFLEKSGEIYQSILQTQRSPRDPVVVPSASAGTKVHQLNHQPADGIDAMQFFRSLYPLCDRVAFSTPPVSALKEILFTVPRVSFYGFLMAIAKSESINEHIGRLPPKTELLETGEAEISSIPPIKTPTSSSNKGSKSRSSGAVSHREAGSRLSHSSSTSSNHRSRSTIGLVKHQKRSVGDISVADSSSETDSSSDSSDTN
ncbi:centriolar satellite-associated tubulin polyglutamylase complex regulator 1-like isoform X1 [Haliotis cracherodii]|uniref:centriolar satellite-associated tubulin polyglutamylase complex regulator 1-like isoform X1 n=1 Tax=Haliotis cracherodii TaxID=6455 RepID=UPI0039E96CC0